MQGIDIYSGTDPVDWTQVARSGYQFACIKVSQGLTYVNPNWRADRDAAKQAGLVGTILYHFCSPTQASGAANASHFLAALGQGGGLQPGDGLAIDVEDDPDAPTLPSTADLRAFVLDCLHTLSPPQSPYPPVFRYWGQTWGKAHNLAYGPDFAPHPYWYPAWADTSPGGEMPVLVQTGQRQVGGIANPVDVDAANLTAYDLTRYLWGYLPTNGPGPVVAPPDLPTSTDVLGGLKDTRRRLAQINANLAWIEDTYFGLQGA